MNIKAAKSHSHSLSQERQHLLLLAFWWTNLCCLGILYTANLPLLPVHHIPMCDELDVVSTTALEVNQLIAGPSTMSFQLTA